MQILILIKVILQDLKSLSCVSLFVASAELNICSAVGQYGH